MDFLYGFFFFVFGAIVASFLNLCVCRIEKKESVKGIFIGRSFCDNCRKSLKSYELIPIFSFLLLKGKCPSCSSKIPIFNIFSELFLATAFLLFFLFELPYLFFVFLIILYFFAVYDFHYESIPKNITDVILVISFLFWSFYLLLDYDVERFYTVLIVLLLWFVLAIFSRKKTLFGLGDILILLLLAFWLELEIFSLVLFSSFLIGGVFALFLVLKDRVYLKKYIPFIPFVLLGFVFACLSYYSSFITFDYIFSIW